MLIYLSGDQSISLRVPSEEEDDNIDDNLWRIYRQISGAMLSFPHFRPLRRVGTNNHRPIISPHLWMKEREFIFRPRSRGRYTAAITFTSV